MISSLLALALLQLPGGNLLWTIVGVLLVIALMLYIFQRVR